MTTTAIDALLAEHADLELQLADPALHADAATGVEDLLLAGVERVALRADVGVDGAALGRAAGLERGATGAGDRGRDVVGVDVLLHDVSPWRCPGRRVQHGAANPWRPDCAPRGVSAQETHFNAVNRSSDQVCQRWHTVA